VNYTDSIVFTVDVPRKQCIWSETCLNKIHVGYELGGCFGRLHSAQKFSPPVTSLVMQTALAILACWFASVGTTDALLNARAWRSASFYPDSSDFPESNLLEHRPNTAISFSGGGSRAYIAAMGYLAALRDLDLLKNVRYIGGISGGSWATIAFTYLQNHTDDNAFLGEIVPPEAIRFDKLKFMDPRCARAFPNTNFTAVAKEVRAHAC
jgi:hypothetical protein